MSLQYVKPTPISLKGHPEFDEKWLQKKIEDDPSILGLGDLDVRDVERPQPHAGRLDLLLREPDTGKRYEVEIQLGAVDPSHIIRTIEYWDIERKRYPQYEHCAVIVAEDITSRFLNVIGLFNSAIPIIAIQLNALQVEECIVLNFTKVLDELVLGEEDDDEDTITVDRVYWEKRLSGEGFALLDRSIEMVRSLDDATLQPNYKKRHIGMLRGGRVNNFIIFVPKKKFVRVAVKIAEQEKWKTQLEEAGIPAIVRSKIGKVALDLTSEQIQEEAKRNLIQDLFNQSYREEFG